MSQPQTQSAPAPAPVKMTMKERRMAREIKKYQQSESNFLPRATFRRLVSSVTVETVGEGIRFNALSIKALQCAAENELTTVFQGANILAHQAGRDTVTPLDVQTFRVLRKM
jgi:histone H3/H4